MQTSNGVYNRFKQTLPCTITIIAQNYNATKLHILLKFLKTVAEGGVRTIWHERHIIQFRNHYHDVTGNRLLTHITF